MAHNINISNYGGGADDSGGAGDVVGSGDGDGGGGEPFLHLTQYYLTAQPSASFQRIVSFSQDIFFPQKLLLVLFYI